MGMNTFEIYSNKPNIKVVAIYLRKSRGDDESVLDKHKSELVTLCERKEWRYIIYSEIGSGDSIVMRPKMKQLLKDVEGGMFDGVVVYDYDRLGRGDLTDQAYIQNIFKKTNTYIITPYKIYDLSNEFDEEITEFQGFMARREYKMIKKRLMQGKKIGAKLGNWTNGTPPFPYEYDPNRKGLVVNEDKLPTYRFMVEEYLNGKSLSDIAWELNKIGIPSPRNGRWHEQVIKRLLADETHLGKIISNKTEGHPSKTKRSSKPFRVKPRSEWIIVENCHKAVKTQEEHDKILETIKRRRNKRGANKIYPLTGLLRCGLCGSSLGFLERSNKILIRRCQHRDINTGEKCKNRGGTTDLIIKEINMQIEQYYERLIQLLNQDNEEENKLIPKLIKEKEELILRKERALDRIREAYEEGVYTLEEFHERSDKAKYEIQELEDEVKLLKRKLKSEEKVSMEERIRYLEYFKEEIGKPQKTSEDLNKLYKTIIESITWIRTEDDEAVATINFM